MSPSHCDHRDGGGAVMTGELYPELAPNTVQQLHRAGKLRLLRRPYFHRVIPGFMIQGGCPQGNGMGGPAMRSTANFLPTAFTRTT